MAAPTDLVVYAESHVLPYGSTLRFDDGPGSTECLMDPDGLTCIDSKNVGMQLSRGNLTPLIPTAALASDTRPQPNWHREPPAPNSPPPTLIKARLPGIYEHC